MNKTGHTFKVIIISVIIFIFGQFFIKYGTPYLNWLITKPQSQSSLKVDNDSSVDWAQIEKPKQPSMRSTKTVSFETADSTNKLQRFQNSSDIQAIAKLYETFAGFITTLLTIISVLGVLFAYIIRKNIKELETEIRTRGETQISAMKSSMEEWKKTFEDEKVEIQKLKKDTQDNLKLLDDYLRNKEQGHKIESPQDKAQELDSDPELQQIAESENE